MLKDVVLRQKLEKERLRIDMYVPRVKSQFAEKWLDSPLMKVILGPRRAGKSVFCFMLLKKREYMYFNFDDESLGQEGGLNTDELMRELHAAYGKIRTIFFDEIQNLPQWELFANRLQREGYNLILTGSNAQLLSKELATHLTGRHISVEVLPFDFREYLSAKKYSFNAEYLSLPQQKGALLEYADKYLYEGGFPEVTVSDFGSKEYLEVLLDALLFKDVVKRHRVKFSSQISMLNTYFINTFASPYSLRKIQNLLGFKSVTTTEKYTAYLEEAYIIFSLLRYSPKAGERIRSPRKVYVADNGFVSAKAVQRSPDTGKFMENLVFMELVKRGKQPNKDLFYYRTRNDREVDFILKQGTAVEELIQVTYQTDNPETEKRETKALVEAAGETNCSKLTLVTWNEKRTLKKDKVVIEIVPLTEWLLKEDK